jgi:uncharacterized membrane protein YqgA involved in biofilm formation
MMRGPLIDSSSVLLGGMAGAVLGNRIPERLRTALPMTFGLCSMGLGIALTVQVKHLAAMVLALVLGVLIGELFYLERGITTLSGRLRGLVDRILPQSADSGMSQPEYLQTFVAVVVLFCASGTGIFGSMQEGMTGDSTILLAKALLDFFTAAIFATQLGFPVAIVAVPQIAIQLALYFGASWILPLTTPALIADFSAVGGLIMFATGLRICKIREFSVANMIPALVLVMPASALWTRIFHV